MEGDEEKTSMPGYEAGDFCMVKRLTAKTAPAKLRLLRETLQESQISIGKRLRPHDPFGQAAVSKMESGDKIIPDDVLIRVTPLFEKYLDNTESAMQEVIAQVEESNGKTATVRWFYHPEYTHVSRSNLLDAAEVVRTELTEEVSMERLGDKRKVVSQEQYQQMKDDPEAQDTASVFFWRLDYSTKKKHFSSREGFPDDTSLLDVLNSSHTARSRKVNLVADAKQKESRVGEKYQCVVPEEGGWDMKPGEGDVVFRQGAMDFEQVTTFVEDAKKTHSVDEFRALCELHVAGYDVKNALKNIGAQEKARKVIPWTTEDRVVFLETMKEKGKDFRAVAQALGNRTTAECVEYYYRNKKAEDFVEAKKSIRSTATWDDHCYLCHRSGELLCCTKDGCSHVVCQRCLARRGLDWHAALADDFWRCPECQNEGNLVARDVFAAQVELCGENDNVFEFTMSVAGKKYRGAILKEHFAVTEGFEAFKTKFMKKATHNGLAEPKPNPPRPAAPRAAASAGPERTEGHPDEALVQKEAQSMLEHNELPPDPRLLTDRQRLKWLRLKMGMTQKSFGRFLSPKAPFPGMRVQRMENRVSIPPEVIDTVNAEVNKRFVSISTHFETITEGVNTRSEYSLPPSWLANKKRKSPSGCPSTDSGIPNGHKQPKL